MIKHGAVGYNQQRLVTEFYNDYDDTKILDKILLDLVINSDKERCANIISLIKTEIENTIEIYQANKQALVSMDTYALVVAQENMHRPDIERQLQEVQFVSQELKEIHNSLEALTFKSNADCERDMLWRKQDRYTQQYKEEKAIMNELVAEKNRCVTEAIKYATNIFTRIYDLASDMLNIVNGYIAQPTQPKESARIGGNATTYFDMGLISAIHKLCNDNQFDDISEVDFFAFLNLQKEAGLNVKAGEKIRVSFLIYRLSLQLHSKIRDEWRTAILDKLDIAEGYYKSKYKEPISSLPSLKSEGFAEALSHIVS
ncbi:MAG: hypothetical protein SNH35_03005 [Rikenellaceae bacterium]